MTKPELHEFMTGWAARVVNEVHEAIEVMAEDGWDGHEVREFAARYFDAERSDAMRKNGKRRRDFLSALSANR